MSTNKFTSLPRNQIYVSSLIFAYNATKVTSFLSTRDSHNIDFAGENDHDDNDNHDGTLYFKLYLKLKFYAIQSASI